MAALPARRFRSVSRWRVLLGSVYNNPANATVVEVKTIVYHSSYLPFVDANIDDNSRDLAVLALSQPIAFSGESPPPPRAVSTGRWPRTIRLETIRDAGSQE